MARATVASSVSLECPPPKKRNEPICKKGNAKVGGEQEFMRHAWLVFRTENAAMGGVNRRLRTDHLDIESRRSQR